MTDNNKFTGVVNTIKLPSLDPPANTVGMIGWMKKNLFANAINTIFTLAGIALLLLIVPPILSWTLFDAVWTGGSEACKVNPNAACWPFVGQWWEFFLYGFYEQSERWRVDMVLWTLYVWVAFIVAADEGRLMRPNSTIIGFVIAFTSLF